MSPSPTSTAMNRSRLEIGVAIAEDEAAGPEAEVAVADGAVTAAEDAVAAGTEAMAAEDTNVGSRDHADR